MPRYSRPHLAELTEAPELHEHFNTLSQQRSASELGMWVFLATEVLFFGGLLLAYAVYRSTYPGAWALASRETNIVFGSVNTAILLTSSLTMALAVHNARERARSAVVFFLLLTALLGAAFLVVKGFEYAEDIRSHLVPGPGFHLEKYPGTPPAAAQMFFFLYWFMTLLHATHLTIGIGVVLTVAARTFLGRIPIRYPATIEVTGLYWHFVDIVWVFLYPLLYLVNRHG